MPEANSYLNQVQHSTFIVVRDRSRLRVASYTATDPAGSMIIIGTYFTIPKGEEKLWEEFLGKTIRVWKGFSLSVTNTK